MSSKHNVTVNSKEYVQLGLLGKGGSSSVHRVVCRADGGIYALKRVELRNDEESDHLFESYANEIDLLKNLSKSSPYIIDLVDYEVDADAKRVLMILEAGDIDLNKLLVQKQKQHAQQASTSQFLLDPIFSRMIWKEMLYAVHHIHEHRIVHGDLKPANFVFVKGHLKLIDFGVAKGISSDTTNIYRDSHIGTVNYMAPEAILPMQGSPSKSDSYAMKLGRASDIWSLGCILYQMTYGSPPFAHLNTIQKLSAIPNANISIAYPDHIDQAAMESIQACLQRQAKDRAPIQGTNGLLQMTYLQIPNTISVSPTIVPTKAVPTAVTGIDSSTSTKTKSPSLMKPILEKIIDLLAAGGNAKEIARNLKEIVSEHGQGMNGCEEENMLRAILQLSHTETSISTSTSNSISSTSTVESLSSLSSNSTDHSQSREPIEDHHEEMVSLPLPKAHTEKGFKEERRYYSSNNSVHSEDSATTDSSHQSKKSHPMKMHGFGFEENTNTNTKNNAAAPVPTAERRTNTLWRSSNHSIGHAKIVDHSNNNKNENKYPSSSASTGVSTGGGCSSSSNSSTSSGSGRSERFFTTKAEKNTSSASQHAVVTVPVDSVGNSNTGNTSNNNGNIHRNTVPTEKGQEKLLRSVQEERKLLWKSSSFSSKPSGENNPKGINTHSTSSVASATASAGGTAGVGVVVYEEYSLPLQEKEKEELNTISSTDEMKSLFEKRLVDMRQFLDLDEMLC